MENTISFQNDGLIDLRALKTFGVSAKVIGNPIGFFGTGLKYSLAILIREGCKVTIWRGLEKYEFAANTANVRDVDFSIVTMNGEELAFTTELGKNWELWQAFRELWCNCKDEKNGVIDEGELLPADGITTIFVTSAAFADIYRARHEIVLEGKPHIVSEGVHIFEKPSSRVFYKGIRVGELQNPAEFTYDIVGHKIRLTEDRTVAWYWEPVHKIAAAILTSDNERFVYQCLRAKPKTLEAEIDLDIGVTPGPVFMKLMDELPFRELANYSAIKAYKKTSGTLYAPDETPMDAVEKEQLRRAIDALCHAGFPVDKDPISITNDLPETILACVYEKQIYLSRRIFMRGTKQVTAALLEEHLHLRNGFIDESRELQTFLFDFVISLMEKVNGSPL